MVGCTLEKCPEIAEIASQASRDDSAMSLLKRLLRREIADSKRRRISPRSLYVLGAIMAFLAFGNATDFFGDGTKGSIAGAFLPALFSLLCFALAIGSSRLDSEPPGGGDLPRK